MNFGKRTTNDDNWSDVLAMNEQNIIPEQFPEKRDNFARDFMNFGKRSGPVGRSLMSSDTKKSIDMSAFNRDFLSFG